MSLQHDGPLDPHTPPQWDQCTPPYSGHQWTCDLCKSTFRTLEQRERHQQECSANNLTNQQSQFSTTVSSRPAYAPRLERADVPPRTSYPPPMAYSQRQRMPANTRHPLTGPAPPQLPSGKRRVVLHWVKESPTLDLEVSYIDDTDGGLVLEWNSLSEWFQCEAALSLGQHSGCLTLGRRDTILAIKPFFVEQGAPSPQKIVISTGQGRVPQTVVPAVLAREERGVGGSEKIPALERDLGRLTADLDSRNNELLLQKQEKSKCDISLEKYKRDNEELSQQVERLSRDNARLQEERKGGSEFPVEMEKLRLQLQAWERRQEALEREAEAAQAEKQVANDYSDYLHGQKKLLEGQLLKLKGELEESQAENTELKQSVQKLSKDTEAPPPLPTRSKPVLKAPLPKPQKEPSTQSKQSTPAGGGGGEESKN